MNASRSPIILLPEALQNQIAAGEVVERPASIIKELVENSLDAKATDIEVIMENGGHTFIQVRDNGFGIPPAELRLALTRHATNKIKDLGDIWKIHSFGFRGEALPSIASVSSFKIESAYTKESNNTEAAFLQIKHGKIEKEGPSSLYKGTIITVQDLFATVPARLKFLKSPVTEQKRAQEIFSRLALTTNTTMTLFSGTRELLKFPAAHSLHQRLKIIWPEELTSNLIPVDKTTHDIRIHGLTSPPTQTQLRSDRILLYVNGRTLNDKLILRAIFEAYKGRLISKEYPQAVLFIEISPELIDVNVHPAKTEVRFRDEKSIFSAINAALKEAINKTIPNFSLQQTNTDIHPKGFWGEADQEHILPIKKNSNIHPTQTEVCTTQSTATDSHDLSLQHMLQNTFVFESDCQQSLSAKEATYTLASSYLSHPSDNSSLLPNLTSNSTYPNKENELPIQYIDKKMCIGPYHYLGQIGDTYLILEDIRKKNEQAELIILDQHAVHERILTEKFRNGSLINQSQQLVLPIQLKLHYSEQEELQEISNSLTSLGFIFSLKGDILHVESIPPLLDRSQATIILRKALSRQQENIEKLWISMACKAAIKAGLPLPPDEAALLITQWISIEKRENCPHGRPCVLVWTIQDLDKLFKRRS